MEESRKNTRTSTLLTAKVRAEASRNGIDCVVLNVSRSGARIMVPNDAEIPGSFVLEIDRGRQVHNCKRVWRNGPLVGLKFDGQE